MSIVEKKRKHKDSSEKSSKKKQKKSSTKIVAPVLPATSTLTTTSLPTVSSSFSEVVVKLYLHLAPMWSGKTMEGVNEQLNAFLMKYLPEVDGIVLAHSDVKFVTDKGKILYDSPFFHFFVTVKFLVWKPKRGSKLVGRINLQSEDHIGLLIYGTFNASIPKSRIPSSVYEWKVNEEEEPVEIKEEKDESEQDDEAEAAPEERTRTQYGEWINKSTGASIGGEDGILEFSVVDIIEANDILTVTGSL
ncbi:DNA-directed RNA polymerase I subunit rpa43 [Choanephora cucurbitarum]|uniref:DNA-directed RNA polymerase I subunit rpa43 n=1 Tax=Choanephora cucurbitarum TaxID=101091 RepID=A0A1C7N729_9FUNG|nr:DNA-directed RNA polymerase I subunit rpa43 [Choanephora cucurbitarum]